MKLIGKNKKNVVDRRTEQALLERFSKVTLKYPLTDEKRDVVFTRVMDVRMPVLYLHTTFKDFYTTILLNVDDEQLHLDEFVEPKVIRYFEAHYQKKKPVVFSFESRGLDYFFVSMPVGVEYPSDAPPFLKITKPERVFEQQRRNFYRQAVKNVPPIFLAVKADRQKITNISGGGLRFIVIDEEEDETKWAYQGGMQLDNHHLLIYMPEHSQFADGAKEKPVFIRKSTVVNASPFVDGGGYSCGLRFDVIDEEERDLIIEYIHVLQTRERFQIYLSGGSIDKIDIFD